MTSSKYLSSDRIEHLPRSEFKDANVAKMYDELGLDYEHYIIEDEGRATAIQWVISQLSKQHASRDEGPYVVDLGCAGGRPTVETIAHSLRDLDAQQTSNTLNRNDTSHKHVVLGVDLSEGQLTYARQRISALNPIAQFEQGDMRTWSPPGTYSKGGVDAVLSFYALNHLPPEDMRVVVENIATWLRPGGVMALGVVAHVNGWVKWMGYDVAAASLPLSELCELAKGSGLLVERAWDEEWKSTKTEGTRNKINQFVLAVKP